VNSQGAASRVMGVTNLYPNSLWQALTEMPWRRLLSRSGDAFMFSLLLHAMILRPLPDGYLFLSLSDIDSFACVHTISCHDAQTFLVCL
jgi:hypothetical protein